MATRTFGQIAEFRPEAETITAYLERTKLFFTANDVPEQKQVSVLLSVIGRKTYALLRSLLAPTLPQDKPYSALVEILTRHFDPKPLVIAERFHFHRQNQAPDEMVAEYIAELRRLSTHCEFGDYLDPALRDRLVCGLHNESVQRRLLAEADLTLKRARDIAQEMEAAERNAKSLKGTPDATRSATNAKRKATSPLPAERIHCQTGGPPGNNRRRPTEVSAEGTPRERDG